VHNLCNCDQRKQAVSTVEALLTTVDKSTSDKFQPCGVSKEMQYLKLGQAYDLDGISSECLWHLRRIL
jgi:hypothetical protein